MVPFATSRDRCPNAFGVTLARFSACALCDPAVDHEMPNRLFAVVVRWLDALGKHEEKIVLQVDYVATMFRDGLLAIKNCAGAEGSEGQARVVQIRAA